MAIKTQKPPMKESVGAQYIVFDVMDEDEQYTNEYEADVEKTKVVKSVKVTENAESSDTYASGEVYDSDAQTPTIDIETEVVAFADKTLSRMKGDNIDKAGLILSGGKRTRPYFAYGKVVILKRGGYRYEWYPKCKLAENSDDTKTKEEKLEEQTDTIKITAYPFNDAGDIVARVNSSTAPEGLTEEKFFTKPILTPEDLATAIAVVDTATPSEKK